MEFNLTTFVLEVLNFLVLVWLLRRFLYRPVLAVIEARRADGARILDEARAAQDAAEALRVQYEARLEAAGKERGVAMAALERDIAEERTRRLAALDAELAEERKRREALDLRQGEERERAQQHRAIALAAGFATRLLERLAGPELEARLVDLAQDDLAALSGDTLETVRAALCEPGATVKVTTAHALDDARRGAFAAALGRLAGRALEVGFGQDPQLKAGVRVSAGPWVLAANLRDELGFFAGDLDHGA